MDVLSWPEEEVRTALALMADEAEISRSGQNERNVMEQAGANARALGI